MDAADNYESLAAAWANHLDKPFPTHGRELELSVDLIGALWSGVYPETIEFIESDPHQFADRVAVYRHAHHEKGAGE